MRLTDVRLRHLRTFCAVVEHGGFGGAQSILGASQSVISTHIKELEISLGFALCKRGRGGFALTRKGEAVYSEAKQVLSSIKTCEANLGTLRKALVGHLRVGIVDGEADNPELPVHAAIRRFFEREQQVHLTLEVGTPETLSKALQTGDVHIAVGPFPRKQPNIKYVPVYSEEHALYCGALHPLFGRPDNEITPEVLSGNALTVRPYLQRADLSAFGDVIANAFVSNMEAQAILIRSGCFLGFLPVHFAQKWVDRGEMRRIVGPGLGWQSQFYIASRKTPESTEITRLFAADLATVLAQ